MSPPKTAHFRTCPLCEAMCGLAIETDGESITSIRGDEHDPFSRGYICPKGPALKSLHEDPDRLRGPVKKVGKRFVPIEWDEAIEIAAAGIHRVQAAHGRDSMAIYLGNPTVHSLGASLFGPFLVRALRTKNRFSATSVDQLPHHLAAYQMFGHQLLIPVPDVDRTDHFVILGANPLASNGSLMSAPGMRRRLKAIQARGGRVVVIDPRRTETAQIADEHHFVRPGTDAWLLAAILRTAIERGRGLGRLAPFVERWSALRHSLEAFTIERAASMTGIAQEEIERLADELCAAKRAVVYGRMGLSTQPFGSICQWLIHAINIATGNFDRPGGSMFTTPAVDGINAPAGFSVGRGSHGRWKSRLRGLPETGGELPVAVLAEEMLTEGEGQIRGFVTSAGNPVLSTPNGEQLDRALEGLEHMVSIDFYINETTRHADVILPPPSPLERPHYDVAFHLFAVRNTAKYAPALFDPGPNARHEWQIVLDVIERLAELRGGRDLKDRAKTAVLRKMGPVGLLDAGLRVGPYGALRGGLRLSRLEKNPHGIDLGPLEPAVPKRTRRWRDKIDLAPESFVADLVRLTKTERAEGPELSLIGRRHLRSNNSWMHNAPKLMAGKPICTLLMHPDDAGTRSIKNGATVEVSSRVGSVCVSVEISDEVMPGVVSLPHGFGHDRDGVSLSVARKFAGVSVNDLTDDQRVDELSGNAVLNGVPVSVSNVVTGP